MSCYAGEYSINHLFVLSTVWFVFIFFPCKKKVNLPKLLKSKLNCVHVCKHKLITTGELLNETS